MSPLAITPRLRAALAAVLCLLLTPLLAVALDHSPAASSRQPAQVALPTPTTAAPRRLTLTVNQAEATQFPLTTAYVTVASEGGAPVTGLGPQHFELVEDGAPVATVGVTTTVSSQQPLAVAIVMDISGSMQGRPLEYAKQAATSLLDILGPRDVVELISFSDYAKVNQPFTTTASIVAKGISNLSAGGDTALYDAVSTTIQSLAQLGPGRKVAVLLTDGQDTRSRTSLDRVLTLAGSQRVPLFTVGLGADVDRPVLDQLAEQSGGATIYAPSPADLLQAYRLLGDQLRSQYLLSFVSSLKADAKEHKLLVRATVGALLAEGHGKFIAVRLAPWIDIVAPRAGQVIVGAQQVQVSAAAGSPAAQIKKLSFVVDGLSIGEATAPPYEAELVGARLGPGPHTLRVTAEDTVGNTLSREISFSVELPTPTPQPTATPTPVPPAPSPPPPSEPNPWPAVVAASFLLISAVATVLVWRRGRRPAPVACLSCGTVYDGHDVCPTCALDERRLLLRRLREIFGQAEGETPPDRRGSGESAE